MEVGFQIVLATLPPSCKENVSRRSPPDHRRVYNATTTPIMTLHRMFTTMAEVMVSKSLVEDQELRPWVDLPMCSNYDGRSRYTLDHTKLDQDMNLSFASFREVVERTIPGYHDRGWPPCQTGLSVDKEAEILRLLEA